MIEIKGMKKIYRNTDFELEALKGIDIHIKKGEFVAVMGESGSGKSTLLNCIGLMDFFDEGSYLLNGNQIKDIEKKHMTELRKNTISFIFQNYELMRNYTLYENIEIPLLAKNIKKKERREVIADITKKLGIETLMKKYPYQISGGQQQRVAIARAIVADNPVILADEPTGALDSKNSEELMNYMILLKEMSKTIVMVTHDEKIAAYSDRVIYLEDGKIC
ncbi:MAG: ABC transporter ATP-binding protein [Lachnospiraceae bacterium]|nr:ABC transporter ATP-binding protein [Lachnospiraceae bacterium]